MTGGISAATALAQRELDLLRGLPAVLDLGLLASRSAAAAQCALAGKELDDIDRQSLAGLASLLRSAAEAVEFFDTEGKTGSYPGGAFADSIDITVDAILLDTTVQRDPAEVADFMGRLAAQIDEFSDSGAPDAAAGLEGTFTHITDLIQDRTGSAGETTSLL